MQLIKKKRVLACLLAAMLALPVCGMTVNSEEPEDTGAVTQEDESAKSEDEENVKIKEAVEEVSIEADVIEQYMKSVGEMDGYAVYLRTKDYKKEIEAEFLAKVGSVYEDEDEAEDAADEIIDQLKKAELAMIDTASGKPAAVFDEVKDSVYLSDAGRYLVVLNEDNTKVQKIRYRVSTLDSEFLFLTKDKNTLELYTQDYKEVYVSMTLDEKNADSCIYRSSDKLWWAMLSPAQNQAWACVKQVAENDGFVMYVDEYTAVIALENKQNGYIWWSSPLNANRDTRATKLLSTQLRSSVMLQYGNEESRSVTNQRSLDAAELKVKEISDGVEITYKFDKSGITVPVTYKLREDYLETAVDCSKIKESKANSGIVATQLTLMGNFGAGASDEEGYFVLPDGCGALVNFNNGKINSKEYAQRVYGRDITTVLTTKSPVTEKILMPVYGIVKEDNAMAVVIEEGDGNATLNTSVSGQSLSSYNICNFSFQLRGSDTFILGGNQGGSLTVFEEGGIKTENIKLRYYPIAKDGADYVDVAEVYRNYLLDDGGVKRKSEADHTEMYLDLYGGTMKTKSVLGIPINMKTAMTRYDEAQEIISGLVDFGVEDMVVVYNNWTNEGITGKVDNKAKPAGILGGSGKFNDLTDYLEEQGFAFYPSVNNKTFVSGNGHYSFTDTAIRISGSFSRQPGYNLSYGVQDASVKTRSLLSPAEFKGIYDKLSQRYVKKSLTGVSLGEMTSTLYGDYGKVAMSRDDTKTALQESYQSIQGAGLSVLADTCAAYAFPYADRISDVPLQSSGFDVFDADIPFYQIVMHGVIPYAGTAINGSADSDNAFLTSIATGCNPAYDMIYAEASDLKDTKLDTYFYSHYAFWQKTAADQYALASELLSGVSDQLITDYMRDGDISITVYEDGTEMIVNYEQETITVNGTEYRLADMSAGKGE
ncbi:MAG: hypothetical protein E7504_04670 [Ruminococcus sp.]|nr:hypothetical protein [Ruminococcus sp.]